MNLDLVISHALEHLVSEFEETERSDFRFVGTVKYLNSVSFTSSTFKCILAKLTSLVGTWDLTVLADNLVDVISVEAEVVLSVVVTNSSL